MRMVCIRMVLNEDRDSGTESDDEPFDEAEIAVASEMSSDVSSSGCSMRSRPTSQTSTDTLTCDDFSATVDMPPPSQPQACSAQATRSRTAARNAAQRPAAHSYNLRTPLSPCGASAEESPIDALLHAAVMSDTDPVEHHSSEEELEPLTGSAWLAGASEKRKWSQVGRLSMTDSGSSDDDFCAYSTNQTPVRFRTSPPIEAHKSMVITPIRCVPPPPKILNLARIPSPAHFSQPSGGDPFAHPMMNGGAGPNKSEGVNVRAPTPRKRHRHTQRHYRPCLDFEKMQQMKNRAVTQWRNGGELSLSFF